MLKSNGSQGDDADAARDAMGELEHSRTKNKEMMMLPFIPDGALGPTSSLSSGRAEPQGGFASCPGYQRALALGHPRANEQEQPCPGCQGFDGNQT